MLLFRDSQQELFNADLVINYANTTDVSRLKDSVVTTLFQVKRLPN